MSADRRGINVLLAALDIEQRELAARMGYRDGYVSNVFNGFAEPSNAFKEAFGDVVADLLLGPARRDGKTLPAAPLVEFLERRAQAASSRPQFYADLGVSPHGWNKRQVVTVALVDRVCCALGVHPSYVYGRDYDVDEVS